MLRYEAWTLPWMGDFKRKVARLPDIERTGTGSRQLFTTAGSGSVDLALGSWDRLDEVISDTEGSLIRVFDQYDVVDEWIGQRVSRRHSDNNKVAVLSGNVLASIFDSYLVPPFDAPANPSTQGNWQWGSKNILANPGFEDNPVTPKMFHLIVTGTSGSYTLTDGTDTTSSIAWDALPAVISTAIQTQLGLFIDVIVVRVNTSPPTFLIQMVDPAYGVTLGVTPSGGSGASVEVIEEGGLSVGGGWTTAATIANPGTGGYTQGLEITDAQAHSGTYSASIDPGPSSATSNRSPGIQQIVSVTPGLHQGSYWVRSTATDSYRLWVLGLGEEPFGFTPSFTLVANTWTQISLVDIIIPDGNTQAIFRPQNSNPGPYNPALVFFDDAEFYSGLPISTPGDILGLLVAAHPELSLWVDTSSFDATTDSNGNAWVEEISFEVQWGEHYGHVLDRFVNLSFEWELVPKATPTGTLTHDLFFYNSGGRDSNPSTGLNVRQGILSGEVVRRIPEFTKVTVEGAEGAWTEVENATTLANFGLLENFTADRVLLDEATRTLRGNQMLAYEEANRSAIQIETFRSDDWPIPMVTFRPGDTVPFQLPPGLPKELRRVQRIDYTNSHPVQYSLTGSRLLSGEAAAYDLIWRMWRRFSRPKEDPPAVFGGGGKGGEFTIQIAASNATDRSKSKADYECFGSNDQNTILSAVAELGSVGGRIKLSEGIFDVNPDDLFLPDLPIMIEGCGPATIITTSQTAFSGTLVTLGNGCGLSNLTILGAFDGCSGSLNTGVKIRVNGFLKNVQFHTLTTAILIDGGFTDAIIDGCSGISAVGNFIDGSAGSSGLVLVNNTGVGNYLIGTTNGPNESIVANNRIEGNLLAVGVEHVNFVGNNIAGRMQITTGSLLVVNNNRVEGASGHGLHLGAVTDSVIDGNVVDPTQHGIYLATGCHRNLVSNNLIYQPGSAIDNTYDGVIVEGDSDSNDIRGNRVVGVASGNQPRYAFNIATSTCNDNSVLGNRSGPASDYAAANPYNDSGTGTINTWPGAAAPQGDNLL